MKKHVMKTVLFGLLTALVFGSFATASTDNQKPEIESVNPWPDDLTHGEDIYVDVRISSQDSSVEDAWILVSSNGEQLRSGALVDSNNDGYYVSPVAFKAEGGNTYKITVKASDMQGDQASDTIKVNPECRFNIGKKCLY